MGCRNCGKHRSHQLADELEGGGGGSTDASEAIERVGCRVNTGEAAPGQQVTGEVTFRNNSSQMTVQFTVFAQLVDPDSIVVEDNTVFQGAILEPGETQTFSYSLTAPAQTVDGQHTVTAAPISVSEL
jgi:hypothetical protein